MRSEIRKGINIWSFPADMDIIPCMELAKKAGFEGIELALTLHGPLNLQSKDQEILRIGQAAEALGMVVNSIATGLYWQYSLTSNREENRERAKMIARKQLEMAALLGADGILVCPGAVGVDFKPADVVPDADEIEFFAGSEIVDYEIAYERSIQAIRELAQYAEVQRVTIGIENIWNKFLLSPLEMRRFIDEIGSDWVGVYFDVGNVLRFGYPEQWIRILGNRIKSFISRIIGGTAPGCRDLSIYWPAMWITSRSSTNWKRLGTPIGPTLRCVRPTDAIPTR
jgi:L-ribulose-5-phosphate 3-epimerase